MFDFHDAILYILLRGSRSCVFVSSLLMRLLLMMMLMNIVVIRYDRGIVALIMIVS